MDQTRKYTWVIQQLRDHGKLSLKQLNEYWVASDISNGLPIPRQTFDRWKGAILDMFGIIIECDRKDEYKYYIYNPEVLTDNSVENWALESFSSFNAVANNFQLKDRILIEEIPSSRNFLSDILDAMRLNHIIQLTYHGFTKYKSCTFLVEPYCVKLFQKRWYLLGYSIDDDKMRLYALDRMVALKITDERFDYPTDFNAKDWFNSYFGIVLDPSVEVEKIVLRVDQCHRNYMRTLPFHNSQKEIRTEKNFSDFELELRPTYDFCMELFKVGTWIEVLSPLSLRDTISQWAKDLCKMYKKN